MSGSILLERCRRHGTCMFPNCVCDIDPAEPPKRLFTATITKGEGDIIQRLKTLHACTQKTFLHPLDWKDGKKIVDDAIAEIERLRMAARPMTAHEQKTMERATRDLDDEVTAAINKRSAT